MYDAVIVGAGLAGLAAAERLGPRKVLLLEKADACGGRVLTRHRQGIPYDLGAVFASPAGLDADAAPAVPVAGRLALHVDGQCFDGDTPLSCMRAALAGHPLDLASLRQFVDGEIDGRQLSSRAREVVEAFFHVIHPGFFGGTLQMRQRDALLLFSEGFRPQGNGMLVADLVSRLHARCATGAEVNRLDDEGAWVRVAYTVAGESRTARARVAIIATEPGAARALLTARQGPAIDFLASIHERPGLVCVLAVAADAVRHFNYVVAAGLPFNTVIQVRRSDDGVVLLHVYYLGDRLQHLLALAGEDLAGTVAGHLQEAGILAGGTLPVFTDLQQWRYVGQDISAAVYGDGQPPIAVSPRVFLAGDYTWNRPKEHFPFGMKAAVASGWRAADAACGVLAGGERE